MKIYDSIEQIIGNTPMLELSHIEHKDELCAKVFAKLEYLNPAGSTKDRAALEMINDAQIRGLIAPGSTIIEPTSGNTGIGLAMVAAVRGYKMIIVMPDNMSKERIVKMRAYGAEVILTPGAQGMAGAIAEAEQIQAVTPGSIIAGQFENPANADAHYKTTGPEIYDALDGKVDMFVAGVGTGGTITGTGRYLKEKSNDVRVVAVEPADSAVLSGKAAGPHGLQGIGAGFVPKLLDTGIYDEIMTVTTEQAYMTARRLAKEEGVMVGISSGAAAYAAICAAKREDMRGKNIVVLLPDIGDRYLSTDLYE